MKPIIERNMAVNKETTEFFDFITHPSALKSIIPLEKLQRITKDENLQNLWKLISDKNLKCFKLIGQYKNDPWEIYYVDLETPILFYPVFSDIIPLNYAQQFSYLVKVIKSNLLRFYSQEIESIFIWARKSKQQDTISYYTYKLEDQNIESNHRYRNRKANKKIKSQNSLEKFLDNKRIKSKVGLEGNKEVDDSIEELQDPLSESEIIQLQNGKKRSPFGQRTSKNRLNLLTGREWIKFSKTWFIHRPPSRKKDEILHPAKFPETMIRKFITFFTKPGELVLDPFLGTGSTIIAAKQSNRSGVGIELSPDYTKITKRRLEKLEISTYPPLYQTGEPSFWRVICGDSLNLLNYWEDSGLKSVDFCITSPPYWNQLERNYIRQKNRKEQGLDTKYSDDNPRDIGTIQDYGVFLSEQRKIFGCVHELLRPNGYLVIITNNIFSNGRIYPLAYDTSLSLTQDKEHTWVLKDEKIWLQDDKSLVALGVNYAWVGNRCHQYCLILRKETS